MKMEIVDLNATWIDVRFTDESDPNWSFLANVPVVNGVASMSSEELLQAANSAQPQAAINLAAHTGSKSALDSIKEKLVGMVVEAAPVTVTPVATPDAAPPPIEAGIHVSGLTIQVNKVVA